MRRERWAILAETLVALQQLRAERGDAAAMSAIASRANVPYDRLVSYLGELESHGLVKAGRPPELTNSGEEFLKEFERWRATLDRFDL